MDYGDLGSIPSKNHRDPSADPKSLKSSSMENFFRLRAQAKRKEDKKMSYLVYALGAFLSLCGAIAFYSGYGIIEVERGWAMVIAGSVAFSAGLVIIVLGFILRELSRLEASKEPGVRFAEPHQTFGGNHREGALSPPEVFGQGSDAAPSITPAAAGRGWSLRPTRSGLSATRNLLKTRSAVLPPQRNPADSDTHPPNFPFSARDTGAPSDRLPFESVLGPPSGHRATPKDLRGEQPPAESDEDFFEEPAERAIDEEFSTEPLEVEPAHRSQPLAEPFTEPNPDSPPPAASPAQNFEEELFIELRRAREAVLLRSNLPSLDQTGENEKPEIMQEEKSALPPLSSNTQELAVVGQYETQGTSYVMYSDGSVEARTEHAVFHFKSMAELKAFLESDGRLPQE